MVAKVDMAGATATEAAAGDLDLAMEATGELDLETEVTATAGETMASPQEASSLGDLRQATVTLRAVAKVGEVTKVPTVRALVVRALVVTKAGVPVRALRARAPVAAKAGAPVKALKATPAVPGTVVARALDRVAAPEKVALASLATLVTAGVLETTATREAPAALATTGAAEATTKAPRQVAGEMTTRARTMAREVRVLTVAAMVALDRAPPAAAGA